MFEESLRSLCFCIVCLKSTMKNFGSIRSHFKIHIILFMGRLSTGNLSGLDNLSRNVFDYLTVCIGEECQCM